MPGPTNNSLQAIFAERLRRGRVMRGYSLRELSEALEKRVSHAALQKYEKGLMKPDSDILLALSAALNLRPDFFVQANTVALSGIEFRKRAVFGKKKQDQVIEEAREFFERYLEIEGVMGISTPPLPREDMSGYLIEDLGDAVEEAALKIRRAWELGLGPLPNIHELLEDHGVKLKEVEAGPDFDGLSGWAGDSPVIVSASWLNADPPRKRLTVLHELGHLVMRLPEGLTAKQEETVCYRFAGAMLLPREAFITGFGRKRQYPHISIQELITLKEQWGISINAIMRRAKDLEIIAIESYELFCKHASSTGLRHNEPGAWGGSESSSRFRQLVHRAAAQDLITQSKAAGLLGITLREFDHEFGKAG